MGRWFKILIILLVISETFIVLSARSENLGSNLDASKLISSVQNTWVPFLKSYFYGLGRTMNPFGTSPCTDANGKPAPCVSATWAIYPYERIHYHEGEIRDLQLKPAAQVKADDFFATFAKDLKLDLTNTQMPLRKTESDGKGGALNHYDQHYKGLEVVGAEGIMKVNSAGKVVTALLKLRPELNLDIIPKISEDDAKKIAVSGLGPGASIEVESSGTREDPQSKQATHLVIKPLVIYCENLEKGETCRLAYKFHVATQAPDFETFEVYVDASTGGIVEKISNRRLKENPPWGENVGSKFMLLGAEPSDMVANKGSDGKYYLMEKLGLPGVPADLTVIAYDARKDNPTGGDPKDSAVIFSDKNGDNIFGDAGEESTHAALRVYDILTHEVFNFFKEKFKWLSFDGANKETVTIYIQKITTSALAYYLGGSNSITFDEKEEEGLTDLVIAHEYTHGVIENARHVKYSGETASLDEGSSDIFGYLVCSYNNGDESSCLKDDPINDPNKREYPDTYQGFYYAGVKDCGPFALCYHTPPPSNQTIECNAENQFCDPNHRNGGVAWKWFSLLMKGGKGKNNLNHGYQVDGIGREMAEQILFRTITQWLPKTATYADAREATLLAVHDVYGDKDPAQVKFIYKSVSDAWYAVGVGSQFDERDYFPPDQSADQAYWPVKLSWEALEGEIGWQVVISERQDFVEQDLGQLKEDVQKQEVYSVDEDSSQYYGKKVASATFNLAPHKKYYWYVRQIQKEVEDGAKRSGPNYSKLADPNIGLWGIANTFTTTKAASQLISPVEVEDINPWQAEFKWQPVVGADHYALIIADSPTSPCQKNNGDDPQPYNPNKSNPPILFYVEAADPKKQTPDGLAMTETVELKKDQDYYWWIKDYGPKDANGKSSEGGCSNGGVGVHFKTGEPPVVTLTTPANGTPFSAFQQQITLMWNDLAGATGYNVEVSPSPDFSNLLDVPANCGKTCRTITLPNTDNKNANYSWRVQAIGPDPYDETSPWSDPRTFHSDFQVTQPKLVAKDYINCDFSGDVPFSWSKVPYAKTYYFKLYTKEGGEIISEHNFLPDNSAPAGIPLAKSPGGYCWKVQAFNEMQVPGMESAESCFEVAPDIPVMLTPPDKSWQISPDSVTFSWSNKCPPAKGYVLFISFQDHQSPPAYIDYHEQHELSGGTTSWTTAVFGNATGAWRVVALGPNGQDTYVKDTNGLPYWFSFSTSGNSPPKQAPQQQPPPPSPKQCDPNQNLGPPTLSSPGCSAEYIDACTFDQLHQNCQMPTGQFKWESVPGATKYRMTITHNGVDQIFQKEYTANTATPTIAEFPHQYGYEYHWSIKAKNDCASWDNAPASAELIYLEGTP